MKRFFFEYLYFTRMERIGSAFFLLLSLFSFIVPEVYDRFRPREKTDFSATKKLLETAFHTPSPQVETSLFPFDPNTAALSDFIRLGLPEKTAKSICKYREKGGRFKKPEDFKKIYALSEADYERLLPHIRMEDERNPATHATERPQSATTFTFDPNTASQADLRRLGLPPQAISGLIKYREKGGQFRYKEDLERFRALDKADYQRLEPFVNLPARTGSPLPVTAAAGQGRAMPRAAVQTISMVDINRAGLPEWTGLPGIGEGWAKRIMNFRDKLGGFVSVEQVGETRYLPDSLFQKAKPYLVVSTGIFRKINLNTAGKEDLAAHPYFTYKHAEHIVAYRQQHGPFKTIEGLLNIIPLAGQKDWWSKARPYMSLE